MSYNDDHDDGEALGFFQRHRIAVALAIIAGLAGIILIAQKLGSKHSSSDRKAPELVMVKLPPLPPPPPPPPPPVQQPVPEQKMIEQAPVNEQESKPDDKPEPPKASEPVTTGVKGSGGPDGFGLGGNRGGGALGSSSSGTRGSRWGWYAGKVQTQIGEALRKSAQTRNADLRIDVRIWADITGRITRAKLGTSTGNAALDEEIKNRILTGLQLQAAPPQGMPMPIVLRITAQRPN